MSETEAAIARVYREEYGRIVASLIRVVGDFQAAEDAAQEAFTRAAQRWPTGGIPANPPAWITTVARRLATDALRRRRARPEDTGALPELEAPAAEEEPEIDDGPVSDERLRLVFTCCHPALPDTGQIALTLRTLGGMTTPEIARAFLTPEATIAQRIVRAKQKIREARVPYVVPGRDDLPLRIDAVLTVIYLIFNEGYSASDGAELLRAPIVDEALRLGRTLAELLPEQAEVLGLLALMLLHDARRLSRVGISGEFVPLEEQDRSRWDAAQIAEGKEALDRAMALRRRGPYQIQAAVAALHADARSPGETDWVQIEALYGALAEVAPSPIVDLNRAVATAMARGPAAGLALLAELDGDEVLASYHLFPAARADLLRRAGRTSEAKVAYRAAIALAKNARDRAYLERRLALLSGD